MFEKVFLDPRYMESFHKIALQENYVKQGGEFHDIVDKHVNFALSSRRNPLRKRTLQYLTLFEKVDGIASPFNLEMLIDNGLIAKEATMITGLQSSGESKDVKRTSFKILELVLERDKVKIIEQHLSRVNQTQFTSNKLSLLTKQEQTQIYELYDRCKFRVFQEFNGFYGDRDLITEQFELYEELSNTSFGLHDALCSSLSEGAQIVSPYAFCAPSQSRFEESFEDLSCIAQVMLQEEISILPAPKNLQEVMRMRDSKDIIRFRSVVSEWLGSIDDGNVVAEAKIRKDIKKANKELKRLESWEEYKNSKLAFWIQTIGGHVPFFSNILTIVSTIGDKGYTGLTMKKNGWALLLK